MPPANPLRPLESLVMAHPCFDVLQSAGKMPLPAPAQNRTTSAHVMDVLIPSMMWLIVRISADTKMTGRFPYEVASIPHVVDVTRRPMT